MVESTQLKQVREIIASLNQQKQSKPNKTAKENVNQNLHNEGEDGVKSDKFFPDNFYQDSKEDGVKTQLVKSTQQECASSKDLIKNLLYEPKIKSNQQKNTSNHNLSNILHCRDGVRSNKYNLKRRDDHLSTNEIKKYSNYLQTCNNKRLKTNNSEDNKQSSLTDFFHVIKSTSDREQNQNCLSNFNREQNLPNCTNESISNNKQSGCSGFGILKKFSFNEEKENHCFLGEKTFEETLNDTHYEFKNLKEKKELTDVSDSFYTSKSCNIENINSEPTIENVKDQIEANIIEYDTIYNAPITKFESENAKKRTEVKKKEFNDFMEGILNEIKHKNGKATESISHRSEIGNLNLKTTLEETNIPLNCNLRNVGFKVSDSTQQIVSNAESEVFECRKKLRDEAYWANKNRVENNYFRNSCDLLSYATRDDHKCFSRDNVDHYCQHTVKNETINSAPITKLVNEHAKKQLEVKQKEFIDFMDEILKKIKVKNQTGTESISHGNEIDNLNLKTISEKTNIPLKRNLENLEFKVSNSTQQISNNEESELFQYRRKSPEEVFWATKHWGENNFSGNNCHLPSYVTRNDRKHFSQGNVVYYSQPTVNETINSAPITKLENENAKKQMEVKQNEFNDFMDGILEKIKLKNKTGTISHSSEINLKKLSEKTNILHNDKLKNVQLNDPCANNDVLKKIETNSNSDSNITNLKSISEKSNTLIKNNLENVYWNISSFSQSIGENSQSQLLQYKEKPLREVSWPANCFAENNNLSENNCAINIHLKNDDFYFQFQGNHENVNNIAITEPCMEIPMKDTRFDVFKTILRKSRSKNNSEINLETKFQCNDIENKKLKIQPEKANVAVKDKENVPFRGSTLSEQIKNKQELKLSQFREKSPDSDLSTNLLVENKFSEDNHDTIFHSFQVRDEHKYFTRNNVNCQSQPIEKYENVNSRPTTEFEITNMMKQVEVDKTEFDDFDRIRRKIKPNSNSHLNIEIKLHSNDIDNIKLKTLPENENISVNDNLENLEFRGCTLSQNIKNNERLKPLQCREVSQGIELWSNNPLVENNFLENICDKNFHSSQVIDDHKYSSQNNVDHHSQPIEKYENVNSRAITECEIKNMMKQVEVDKTEFVDSEKIRRKIKPKSNSKINIEFKLHSNDIDNIKLKTLPENENVSVNENLENVEFRGCTLSQNIKNNERLKPPQCREVLQGIELWSNNPLIENNFFENICDKNLHSSQVIDDQKYSSQNNVDHHSQPIEKYENVNSRAITECEIKNMMKQVEVDKTEFDDFEKIRRKIKPKSNSKINIEFKLHSNDIDNIKLKTLPENDNIYVDDNLEFIGSTLSQDIKNYERPKPSQCREVSRGIELWSNNPLAENNLSENVCDKNLHLSQVTDDYKYSSQDNVDYHSQLIEKYASEPIEVDEIGFEGCHQMFMKKIKPKCNSNKIVTKKPHNGDELWETISKEKSSEKSVSHIDNMKNVELNVLKSSQQIGNNAESQALQQDIVSCSEKHNFFGNDCETNLPLCHIRTDRKCSSQNYVSYYPPSTIIYGARSSVPITDLETEKQVEFNKIEVDDFIDRNLEGANTDMNKEINNKTNIHSSEIANTSLKTVSEKRNALGDNLENVQVEDLVVSQFGNNGELDESQFEYKFPCEVLQSVNRLAENHNFSENSCESNIFTNKRRETCKYFGQDDTDCDSQMTVNSSHEEENYFQLTNISQDVNQNWEIYNSQPTQIYHCNENNNENLKNVKDNSCNSLDNSLQTRIDSLDNALEKSVLTETLKKYMKKTETSKKTLTADRTVRLDNILLNIERKEGTNEKSQKEKFCIKRYKKGKMKIYRLKKLRKKHLQTVEDDDDLNFYEILEKMIPSSLLSYENGSSISTPSSYVTDETKTDNLSAGSKELTVPEQRLRDSFNELSKDKSLCYSFKEWEDVTEHDKELIKIKIQDIFFQILQDFIEKKPSCFTHRKQSFDNCIFKDGRLQLKPIPESSMTVISSKAQNSKPKFQLMLYIMKKIQTLLESNTKLTKREFYYQLKEFISNQSESDRAINAVSCVLDAGIWTLNIIAQKGLVFGNLKLLLSSGETLNCNIPGTLIPPDINSIVEIHSRAYFILVVEKESIYHKLIEENLPNKLTRPFILITGKGFPDLNTQLFLRKLWIVMSIPVFILVDADPHGINIMLNYKFGSVRNAHVSHHLAVPNAKWLGVYPSEVINLNIAREPLTNNEIKLVNNILVTPYMQSCTKIADELHILLTHKFKASIEGLIKTDKYLSENYLPNKFFSHNFI